MKRLLVFGALAALSLDVFAAIEWRNLDEEHKLGGRKVSDGYLRGKTVLICRDPALAERMQEIWESYKTKQFVLLGNFQTKVEGCDFPMYKGGDAAGSFTDVPLSVVDETGHYYYNGKDDHNAIQALVVALTDTESPRSAIQFRKFLDYELANLPGAAFNRFVTFKTRFPAEAREYTEKERELKSIEDIKRVAELVAFAKKAKDMREFDPKKAASKKRAFESKLKNALEKYAPLKQTKDERMVQEVKNSLADIKWTLNDL